MKQRVTQKQEKPNERKQNTSKRHFFRFRRHNS